MWTVTIVMGGGGSANLIFEAEGAAKAAFEAIENARKPERDDYPPTMTVTDHYGTTISVDVADIVLHQLQDIRKAQGGNGDLQIVHMRAQIATQQKMQSDPGLRLMMPPGGRMS